MGFRVIEQARASTRPRGEVRVSTSRNATVTLLSVFIGPSMLQDAGFTLGDPVLLLRGEDEDAGWIRVEKCDPIAGARLLGKMPGTAGGNVRFRAPEDWNLPMMTSTDIPDHEVRVERGSVTLRLPALMRGVLVDGETKTNAMHGSAVGMPDSEHVMPEAPTRPQEKWTTERREVLRRLWTEGAGNGEIASALNALPGLPVHRDNIAPYARNVLMLSSRGDARTAPQVAAKAPTSPMTAQSITLESKPARGPDGTESRAGLPAQHPDKAEAVEMLEAGKTARFVAEEFGLPVSTVATWAAEVRARQQDGKAA